MFLFRIVVALLIFSHPSILHSAQATLEFSPQELETGDVLLMSIPCYVCSLIELEEGTPYSHSAVVVREQSSWSVYEAWGVVKKTPLAEFLSRRRKNTAVAVLRPVFSNDPSSSARMMQLFEQKFKGLGFDESYQWDNRDSAGRETYYCSEFVAKFLNPFLLSPIEPKPMHYLKYRAEWTRYFEGSPPDGKPGLSPGDLLRATQMNRLGDL
ncbi:MAG: hypothetical protein EOP09_13510 [Proteobacteria bacterium]|nr:MAG: hypothetical protein EOP09_13510 [Pseudomonadota bacterium]